MALPNARSGTQSAALARAQEARDQAQDNYVRLRSAVMRLYTSAYWHPDRPVDGDKLWSEVRDAAEIEP